MKGWKKWLTVVLAVVGVVSQVGLLPPVVAPLIEGLAPVLVGAL